VELIAKSLIGAKRPLVITGYLGRNLKAPALLAELCDKLPITVVEMVGSDISLRSDHEAYRGVTVTTHPEVLEADVILILDCDVPWIPTAGKPRSGKKYPEKKCFNAVLTNAVGTKVFHLDVDPLKQQMPRKFTYRLQDEPFSASLLLTMY
jgi:thiamine pyrophosphate-dependent acetolactate synthase large subunit-like protein